MNLFTLKRHCLMPALALLFFSSCKKEVYTSDIYIRKQWKADLSASNIIPAITGRTDHAVATVYLMDNNELHYYIYFDKPLNNGDSPAGAVINLGAAGANGTALIKLDASSFNDKRENDGAVTLSAEAAASLVSQTTLYLQVSSSQQPNGLVRGQM
ncbi:CHRD domain-containing protein [Pedobacter sp. 22226]|uniref:CHRD domain-containing protein n=1 Tax=Pedobacter sp. 22226 TaxID=3453894 RepID=UPI003F851A14